MAFVPAWRPREEANHEPDRGSQEVGGCGTRTGHRNRVWQSLDQEAKIVNESDEIGRDVAAGTTPRYSRRLSDKILIAFHHACDQSDFEIAQELLHIL